MKNNNNKINDENARNSNNINWYPGHMAKTKRLIKEKYDLIDIVYEVIDARMPKSSKIKDIDELLKDKPRILIMTKKDLCDLKITNQWVKYYENLGNHVLLLDLNQDNVTEKIVSLTHEIMADMQEKRKNKGLKEKEIRALVIGIPNVGKSTLINRLCKKKVVNVGNNPGITKSLSWLKTTSDILLLDTPGILWPRLDQGDVGFNLASFTAIKQEILPIDDVCVYILKTLSLYYPAILEEKYGLKKVNDDTIIEAYETIGKKIGAFKNGEVDYERVSIKVVNDIKLENIKGITFDRK